MPIVSGGGQSVIREGSSSAPTLLPFYIEYDAGESRYTLSDAAPAAEGAFVRQSAGRYLLEADPAASAERARHMKAGASEYLIYGTS